MTPRVDVIVDVAWTTLSTSTATWSEAPKLLRLLTDLLAVPTTAIDILSMHLLRVAYFFGRRCTNSRSAIA
jgi:hypothetical protein